jgi:hypothetical protein
MFIWITKKYCWGILMAEDRIRLRAVANTIVNWRLPGRHDCILVVMSSVLSSSGEHSVLFLVVNNYFPWYLKDL